MAYTITCSDCGEETKAGNIIWLLSDHHTDADGGVKCKECGSTAAHVYRKSQLKEEGQHWERYIEAIIQLSENKEAIYQPYALLATGEPGGGPKR